MRHLLLWPASRRKASRCVNVPKPGPEPWKTIQRRKRKQPFHSCAASGNIDELKVRLSHAASLCAPQACQSSALQQLALLPKTYHQANSGTSTGWHSVTTNADTMPALPSRERVLLHRNVVDVHGHGTSLTRDSHDEPGFDSLEVPTS